MFSAACIKSQKLYLHGWLGGGGDNKQGKKCQSDHCLAPKMLATDIPRKMSASEGTNSCVPYTSCPKVCHIDIIIFNNYKAYQSVSTHPTKYFPVTYHNSSSFRIYCKILARDNSSAPTLPKCLLMHFLKNILRTNIFQDDDSA